MLLAPLAKMHPPLIALHAKMDGIIIPTLELMANA